MTPFTPKLPPGVRRLFRLPSSRERILRDLDEEMRFHLESRVVELRAAGLSEGEARIEALRRFGDVDDLREYYARASERSARWNRLVEWFGQWGQDFRFTGRQVRKAPGFAAVAVLTLALGIGANTAIFSVVHHLLLAPLPYPDGNRIVKLMHAAGEGDMLFPPKPTVARAWQARARSLETIAFVRNTRLHLDDDAPPDSIRGASVSPTFFPMLGAPMALGRAFVANEGHSVGDVTVIGYDLWQRRYGGRRDVLGSSIRIDGKRFTIVGVAPPDMIVPMSANVIPAVWLPLSMDSATTSFDVFARLRPGITPEVASKELQAIAVTEADSIQARRMHARAMRAQDFLDAREARRIQVLFVAVGVLLLIACANVANLLLARSWTRRREFAIRAALGAGRGRVARQVLTESVSLALAGGLLGLLFAWQGLHVIIAMRPPALEHLSGVHLEPTVLAWSAGLSMLTGILFGAAPALLSSTRFVGDALRPGVRTWSGNVAARRVRSFLVVAEVALSLVLLVGAGLLTRSFIALQSTPLGFEPRGLLHIGMLLPRRMNADGRAALRQSIVEHVRAIPGVTDAAIGPPPGDGFAVAADIEVDGQTSSRVAGLSAFTTAFSSPEYFRAARIALVEGRPFATTATGEAIDEIVVNQALARRLWPDGRAIGSRLRVGSNAPWATVVGIAEDVRLPGWGGERYGFQLYQGVNPAIPTMAMLVRTELDPATLAPELGPTISALDPGLSLGRPTTGDAYIRDLLAPARFAMVLLAAFAAVALLLSAAGLYGVIAYAVSQRTREIGVRVALGADSNAVTRLVVGEGLRLTACGVIIGLVAAAAATRTLGSVLYGVSPSDPVAFSGVVLLLGAIALLASYIPARRALRIDPVEALRAE